MAMDLVVMLEMVDGGLGSSSVSATTFNRSKIYLNTDDYDGATYYFEIIVSLVAATAYDITLYDVTNAATKATISIGPTLFSTKRFRSSSFTPASGKHILAVRIPQTAANGDILIYAARIVVVQAAATKTRLQFPLAASNYNTWSYDVAPGVPADQTASLTYTQGTALQNALWLQERSHLATIAETNPWTLEAVLGSGNSSGVTTVGLFNATDNAQVGSVELVQAGATSTLSDTDFADSLMSGHDGDEFEFRIKTNNASYTAYMSRAALYVRLTNPTEAQVYLRCARSKSGTSGISATNQRLLIDTNQWSGTPTWLIETTGSDQSVSPEGETFIRRVATDDGTGTVDINTGLVLTATKDRVRESATPLDDNNHYGRISSSTGTVAIANVVLIAEISTTVPDFVGLTVTSLVGG